MPEFVRIPRIRVFIASPGDVAQERRIIHDLIHTLRNDEKFLYEKAIIKPIQWEHHPLEAWISPQKAIELGLPTPSECDIVLVTFWRRMGTPLSVDEYKKEDGSSYLSGTEWEYYDAVNGARQNRSKLPKTYLYRCARKSATTLESEEDKIQFNRVEAFFNSFRNPDGSYSGSFYRYETLEEYQSLLRQHLSAAIGNLTGLPSLEDSLERTNFEENLDERGFPPEMLLEFIKEEAKPIELRVRALYVAMKHSLLDTDTVDEIIRDPYVQIREKFADYLARFVYPITEEQMMQLMLDGENGVSRKAVITAKILIESGCFTTSVYKCLEEQKQWEHRLDALRICKEIDDKDAPEAVLQFARGSTYWIIRREASRYIKRLCLENRLTNNQVQASIRFLEHYATDGRSTNKTLKVINEALDILRGECNSSAT